MKYEILKNKSKKFLFVICTQIFDVTSYPNGLVGETNGLSIQWLGANEIFHIELSRKTKSILTFHLNWSVCVDVYNSITANYKRLSIYIFIN